MDTTREKQIAVRVTETEKNEFTRRAEAEGKTPSQVLLEFVRSYIGISPETEVDRRFNQLEAEVRNLRQQMERMEKLAA